MRNHHCMETKTEIEERWERWVESGHKEEKYIKPKDVSIILVSPHQNTVGSSIHFSVKFVFSSNFWSYKRGVWCQVALMPFWLTCDGPRTFYPVTWNRVFTLVIAVMRTIGPVLLRITPLGDWLPGAQGAHIMLDACGYKQLPAAAIKWQCESGEREWESWKLQPQTQNKKDWEVHRRTAESSVHSVGSSLWVTHFISIIYCMHYYSNRKLIVVHIND